jgi:hypothetical protein
MFRQWRLWLIITLTSWNKIRIQDDPARSGLLWRSMVLVEEKMATMPLPADVRRGDDLKPSSMDNDDNPDDEDDSASHPPPPAPTALPVSHRLCPLTLQTLSQSTYFARPPNQNSLGSDDVVHAGVDSYLERDAAPDVGLGPPYHGCCRGSPVQDNE